MKAIVFGVFLLLFAASATSLLTLDKQVLSSFDQGALTGRVIVLLVGLSGTFYSGKKLLKKN
ncbi:hypothetical protein [Pontibacter actiniarum]|uniref:Uncharacterized protein n=1 Tax=Pontibacter actiniarum TaxID=323450 RepID=A0A1X9YX77_9BACT|nr:hypothetical protein [Pontibacter actiniarum]ARS37515.1 hypothetical protein CA264_19945 [Pontibacter actiniarum]